MKWVWNQQANKKHCRQVSITPMADDPLDFQEFPRDVALKTFDRSDRKWVAVALASGSNPEILNAADTDWWNHRKPLSRRGVRIRFLSPGLMGDEDGK